MFQGAPGVTVDWPAVLYPARLPQYEGLSAPKSAEPPKSPEPSKNATVPGKSSGVRQTLSCPGICSNVDNKISNKTIIFAYICFLRIKRGNPEERGRS